MTFQVWTPRAVARLLALKGRGWTLARIAKYFDRGEQTVESALKTYSQRRYCSVCDAVHLSFGYCRIAGVRSRGQV